MGPSARTVANFLFLAAGIIALVTGGAFASSHGGGGEKPTAEAAVAAEASGSAHNERKTDKEAGGSQDAAAPAAPRYTLGESLRGYYDRTLLRYTTRLTGLRYRTGKIDLSLGERSWRSHVRIELAVEFGRESGMAELQSNWTAMSGEIQDTIGRFDPRELILPTGKWRLKEALVAQLNRRLQTARVRNVYITDFIMQRQ